MLDLYDREEKALDVEHIIEKNPRPGEAEPQLELMRLRAHMFLLAERLNFLFEAIKPVDRKDDQADQKSAMLLYASSSQIPWRMVDEHRDLLAKLAVQNIDFYWLRRQRGIFVLLDWSTLPPVSGITIYESFELSLHPLRLQIDAKVGRRIMEYIPGLVSSGFMDHALDPGSLAPLRKLGTSCSFTDLRSSAAQDSARVLLKPPLHRTRSSEYLKRNQTMVDGAGSGQPEDRSYGTRPSLSLRSRVGDAAEMKTRSSRKTFVLVRISSLHLLLSTMKEDAFSCWVKMAFQQPLVPVRPVAQELILKTKWIASKSTTAVMEHGIPPKSAPPKAIAIVLHNDEEANEPEGHRSSSSFDLHPPPSSKRHWKKASH
ncbi:hypothetical protein BT96DRAFT_960138 [Gymnopus androsaceus JB14]|uniref:FMP27 C-terminal domain-containing protein n=1 Tax=Gymnopus androsaceus JB14 TaxID=1447944 RepID=A0A6A4GTV9_9AGAR|nr:hypothetical protein BT96DRAFT_960138 [Gymnopus androsaceus JB14]